ncbi:MAG: hypothetical protein A2275_01330 [Bacteroidetes bacterium RIFOXYA12_FULL_35_11]|nr:MAG: hypothetical protein A2X01_17830 [Bacteroidetes bacterium GWF2_35_48]OFY72437.1 MAG: hypothetical protein A2275_01330 [Bacteroidetes bacterium RIFOXYA12_FULL_35_11]OFY97203.1 MAG: hypothetical protein A2491_14740 [Bacteroidetes bacterium RIFOXYC12_FULL_35_7]
MKSFSVLSILFYLLLSFKATTTTYAQWNDADVIIPQIPVPQPEFNLPCGITGSPSNIINSTINNPAYTYIWTFSDGSVEYSDGSSPDISHTFESYGYYCVDLVVNTGCATAENSKTIFIVPVACACNNVANYHYPDNSFVNTETWNSLETKIEGDLYITQYQTLTLENCTLRFGPKGRIIVMEGAHLIINNSLLSTLSNCPGYLWQGIEVWGNAAQSPLGALQGEVQIDNNSIIENAHIAVLLGARNMDKICDNSQITFNLLKSGGKIKAGANTTTQYSTVFRHNGIGVKVLPKSLVSVSSGYKIEKCNFEGSASLPDPLYVFSDVYTCYPTNANPFVSASSGGKSYIGVYIENLKNIGGISIKDNIFTNMAYGIESANARFDIQKCSFTDLEMGILIHNYTSAVNVFHKIYNQCFFDRLQYGIYINGGKNDMIQDCNFGGQYSLQSKNNCGILAHSSSGFNIFDNNFENFKIGVRVMKSGSTGGIIKNSISNEGNIFKYCRKSIETISDNSALKIKCNTHTNSTNSNTYFRNWTNAGTLAWQGEAPGNDVTKPAGNTFTPYNYQQIYSNTFYKYFCHKNPWSVKPVPLGNVNVDDQNNLWFTSTTACPVDNTTPSIIVLETQFNQLNTSNSVLRLRFDSVVNILDKGQTALLISMIQGNTNEGQLKNKLLTNSPLSDNVLSELISSNKLAPGNFKNVMGKNLPVTKTVEPEFLDKITQLPPGIADQLIKLHGNNPGVVTLASIQRELDRNNIIQKEIMSELTRIYIDSGQTDKAIQLLETQSDAGSKQTLIASLIAENRLAEASTLLSNFIPADADEADWLIVNNILLSLETQGKTIYDLNSAQVLQLRDIATTCPAGLAAMNAQSILRIVFNDKFIPCPDDTLSTARYSNNPENIPDFSIVDEENIFLGDNYPNPFNRKTVIPYYLPEGMSAVMQIKDVHGRMLSEFSLKTGKNLLEINTEDWAAGVYYYSLISNGEVIENKKMMLVK